MATKFTPGPWDWYWRKYEDETDCGVKNADGHSVCRSPRYQTQDRWEADARLISKAPEMFELLATLVDEENFNPADRDDVSAMLRFGKATDEARALLKEIEDGTS